VLQSRRCRQWELQVKKDIEFAGLELNPFSFILSVISQETKYSAIDSGECNVQIEG